MQSSSDEVKQQYVTAMGSQLGVYFYRLTAECVEVHRTWQELISLFGTSQARCDVIYSIAPSFFSQTQKVFWEQTLLHIARLTDRRGDTLNLQHMAKLVDPKLDLTKLLQDVELNTRFVRAWRNKRLAHLDLQLATSNKPTPLPIADRATTTLALQSIVSTLHAVEFHYLGFTTHYEGKIVGGAEPLLRALERLLRYEEGKRER